MDAAAFCIFNSWFGYQEGLTPGLRLHSSSLFLPRGLPRGVRPGVAPMAGLLNVTDTPSREQ